MKQFLLKLVPVSVVIFWFLSHPALADELTGSEGLILTPTATQTTATSSDPVSSIVHLILGIGGVISIIMILSGIFKWMTASGRDDQLAASKRSFFGGLIGLIIVISAYALSGVVIARIVALTSGISI